MTEMSKPSFVDKGVEFTSSPQGEMMKSAPTFEFSEAATKAVDMDMSKASVVDETMEFTSSSLKEKMKNASSELSKFATKVVDKDTFEASPCKFEASPLFKKLQLLLAQREFATSEFSKFAPKDLLDQPPVASPPPSSTVASPREKSSSFDVYLSYNTFAHGYLGDLDDAFVRAGLGTCGFFHDLPEGGDMLTQIERALTEARASIIVLSESYVDSRWCLQELLLIVEQRSNSNHFVLPVFYDSRVPVWRLPRASVEEWMENMDQLEAASALMEVASLPGFSVSGEFETTVIEEIVSTLRHALYPSPVGTQPRPTGQDTQAEDTK